MMFSILLANANFYPSQGNPEFLPFPAKKVSQAEHQELLVHQFHERVRGSALQEDSISGSARMTHQTTVTHTHTGKD